MKKQKIYRVIAEHKQSNNSSNYLYRLEEDGGLYVDGLFRGYITTCCGGYKFTPDNLYSKGHSRHSIGLYYLTVIRQVYDHLKANNKLEDIPHCDELKLRSVYG